MGLDSVGEEVLALAVFHAEFKEVRVAKRAVLFDFEPDFDSGIAIGAAFDGNTYIWGFFFGEGANTIESVALESAGYEE